MRQASRSALNDLFQALAIRIPQANSLLPLMPLLDAYVDTDWLDHVQFSDENYARIPLYRNDIFEILLLCWKPQQCTSVHAHPTMGCLQKILQGELYEERFTADTGTSFLSRPLRLGETTFIENALGTHKVSNLGMEPAVSLHVYAPLGNPLTAYIVPCFR